MNRRGFAGAVAGLVGAAGLAQVPKPVPAPKFVLVRRFVEHVVVQDTTRHIMLQGAGAKYHEFDATPGEYEAIDLESPTSGDPSKVRAVGIKATGERVLFMPKYTE